MNPSLLLEVNINPFSPKDSERNAGWMYYGAYDYGVQSVQNAIREPLASLIFLSPDGVTTLDPSLGPYLFVWASVSPSSPVNLEEDVKFNIRETFVVADIHVNSSEAKVIASPLTVEVNG